MDYIRELKAFKDWVMLNHVSTGQIALWYSLMSINNMTGWTEWFTSPNQTLQLMTGLSRQGLDKARNQLVQNKRIEYQKGKSNQAGTYRIIPFQMFDYQKVGTAVDAKVGTEGAFQLSHEGRKSSTLIDLNKTIQDKNTGRPFQLFESEGFGRISSLIADDLDDLIKTYGDEWVCEAMRVAVSKGKRNLGYVNGILKRWQSDGIDSQPIDGKLSKAEQFRLKAKEAQEREHRGNLELV